jgi:hypothetical protein
MFCYESASTKEHAWPQWLMTRFPSSDIARTYAECNERNLGNWPTKELLVKRICRACNNGWMSRLENEVKPVLESILDDKLRVINISAQFSLALWAVKNAMVLETIDSNRLWFYLEEERRLMCTDQTIPQRTSVWIAKCINHRNVYSMAKDLRTMPGDDGFQAFAITMAFGSLILQVVSIKTPAEIPANITVTYDVSDGPWDQTLIQIWPTSQNLLMWPPTYGLEGELGLEALSERLSI